MRRTLEGKASWPAPSPAAMGWLALVSLLAAQACTNAQLRCIANDCRDVVQPVVDNAVEARGTVCTRSPQNQTYPYKVLLVIDTSASTAESDPPSIGGRENAVRQVLADPNLMDPAIQFAIMTFDGTPTLRQAFTTDRALLNAAAASAGTTTQSSCTGIQGQTDYTLALAQVVSTITQDVRASVPAEVPFTRYDIQWLSDGNPEVGPDCCPSYVCSLTAAADQAHCGESLQVVAQDTNQVLALPALLGFDSIKLSTIFLNAPLTVNECQLFQQANPTQFGLGADYLQQMARQGGGSFQSVSAGNLKFQIAPTTIKRPFQQDFFFLVNYSRVVKGDAIFADSDQDGIADVDEDATSATLMTDKTKPRSNPASACSDLARVRSQLNPGLCDSACSLGAGAQVGGAQGATGDPDGDGLLTCEEGALGSNPKLVDSDGDMLTDDIEARFGTNPQQAQGNLDHDADGIIDMEEVQAGLNPFSPQSDRSLAYVYAPLANANSTQPGSQCFTFEVSNVRLAPTQASSVSSLGDNRLCLFLVQHPVSDPNGQPTVSRACKTANYQLDPNGLGIKSPASGVVTFDANDFATVMCASGPPCGGQATNPNS